MWVPAPHELLAGTPRVGAVSDVWAVGHFLQRAEQTVAEYRSGLESAAASLTDLRGASVTQLRDRVSGRLVAAALSLDRALVSARRACAAYASEVESIHRAADAIEHNAGKQLEAIAAAAQTIEELCAFVQLPWEYRWNLPPPLTLPELEQRWSTAFITSGALSLGQQDAQEVYRWWHAALLWQHNLDGVRAEISRWRALVSEREEAEHTLVLRLRDTELGELIALGAGTRGGTARAIVVGLTGEPPRVEVQQTALRTRHVLLSGMPGPEVGADGLAHPPPPAAVAAWWAGLSGGERAALIEAVPTVIGNLAGLLPSVRDRANRVTLAYFQEHPQLLGPEQRTLVAGILRIMAREEPQGAAGAPIEVLALELGGSAPKAALGYGGLDRATHTSWHIAGMHSDAHVALPTFDEASRNLLGEKRSLAVGSAAARPAVVTWLGYDTPGLAGVLMSTAARRGAARLALELDGMWSARAGEGEGRSVTTVVGHSYGTTTAAIALTRVAHPVDAFVMLGTAGLDTDAVPSLDLLRVADHAPQQKAVFVSTSVGDQLAPLGAVLAGRALPDGPVLGANRSDRPAPARGQAFAFSTDGDPERGLSATDGHSMIGRGKTAGLLGARASRGHGYSDTNTQALSVTAEIAMQAMGHSTTEQLRLQALRPTRDYEAGPQLPQHGPFSKG